MMSSWGPFTMALAAALPVVMGDNTTMQSSWGGVVFTHCGSGSSCGGSQTCSNYEFAMSDAGIWRSVVGIPMSGGYDKCPGGNWESCCHGAHSGVCRKLPSCPLSSGTRYPFCVKASNGKQQTGYLTGCCPSRHPCNVCKAQYHKPGACTSTRNQADLCDNLWHALGSPSQSGTLTLTKGHCGGGPSPHPGPRPSPHPSPSGPCKDVAPDSKYSCAKQKSWGKCSQSFMKGHCCKTCFNCKKGCGRAEDEAINITVADITV